MTNRTRSVLASLALAFAAAGVAIVAWPDGPGDRAPPRPATAPQLAWTPGDARAYEVSVAVSATTARDALAPHRVDQRYTGTLHMRVFGGDDDVLVGFQLGELRLVVEGDVKQEPIGPIDGPPFWVFFDSTGVAREFVFHEGTDAPTREMLEETIRTFQCVVPRGAGLQWSTRESHATGDYTADYAITLRHDILKRKTRYEKEGVELLRSGATFELSDQSWLERASVRDRLTIESDDGSTARCNAVATLAALAPDTVAAPEALRMSYGEALMEIGRHRDAPVPEKKELVGKAYTEEDVTRTLRALNASGGTSVKTLRRLSRQIESNPELIRFVLDALEADGTKEATAAALINALGMAGTPEAYGALAALVRNDERRHANRRRAVIALGFCHEPDSTVINALWETADTRTGRDAEDLSNTALLAIGTVTGTLNERGSEAYMRNRTRLVERVGQSSTSVEKEMVLKALGNTRDVSLSREIARHLDADEDGVRKASAYALRLMKDPGVADLLADRLAQEQDTAVRHRIAASLNRQGATTARSLERARIQVEVEKDEPARFELVDYLARNRTDVPGWRETFERLLRVERSSRIRKKLGAALYVKKDSKRRDG